MIGKIFIKGEIGSYEDEKGILIKGIDLLDVMAMVKAQRDLGIKNNDPLTELEVDIDSPGGICDVGYNIHDFLRSIPESITTIAQGMCASIATIIWFSGDKRINKCPLMIHNPWFDRVSGDADALERFASIIRSEEEKAVTFYAKYTGIEKVALAALMKEETYISTQRAFDLGFSTEMPSNFITEPVNYLAVARTKQETMSKESKTLLDKLDTALAEIKTILKGKPKSLIVVESGGKSLEIKNADGTEVDVPIAGNTVMIDGVIAPDGDYTITDMNVKIAVKDGLVDSVTNMAENADLAAANQKIADLQKEKETAVNELSELKKTTENLTTKITEFEGLLKTMTSTGGDHEAKSRFRQNDDDKKTSLDDYKKAKKERETSYKK